MEVPEAAYLATCFLFASAPPTRRLADPVPPRGDSSTTRKLGGDEFLSSPTQAPPPRAPPGLAEEDVDRRFAADEEGSENADPPRPPESKRVVGLSAKPFPLVVASEVPVESSGSCVYPGDDGGVTGLCSTVKKRMAPHSTPNAPEKKAVVRQPVRDLFLIRKKDKKNVNNNNNR